MTFSKNMQLGKYFQAAFKALLPSSVVKPPYHGHAIIVPAQLKTACFLLCVHSYTIAY